MWEMISLSCVMVARRRKSPCLMAQIGCFDIVFRKGDSQEGSLLSEVWLTLVADHGGLETKTDKAPGRFYCAQEIRGLPPRADSLNVGVDSTHCSAPLWPV